MAKRKRKQTNEQKLRQAYYTANRPGSLGGVQSLSRATKVKPSVVKKFLEDEDTYTLHKPVRKKFPRRKVIVSGPNAQWQADLVDVRRIMKYNDNYAYLLTVIDVFTKYSWVVPIKNKTGSTLVKAFTTILSGSSDRKPIKLQTDHGKEFLNKTFQTFLKEQGIKFFVTQNFDLKASIVERFNRTLKEKLWRYFTKKDNQRYIEVLPKIVRSYNHSFHSSIKRSPASVDRQNQEEVWQALYGRPLKNITAVLKPGDSVRISKVRKTFKKGYLPSWTEEIFKITKILKTSPVTYVIEDYKGEELKGTFYSQELQKVKPKQVFRIEEILKHRTNKKGQKELFVSWRGYPASMNQWISLKSVQKKL